MNKINYQHLFPRIKRFVKNKHWINTSLLNTLYVTASLEHDVENKNSRIYIETLIYIRHEAPACWHNNSIKYHKRSSVRLYNLPAIERIGDTTL